MAVMQVRVMRVPVAHRAVPVRVRMRLADRPVMGMAVMGIMPMRMFMLQRLMRMLMFVAFGQVQPETHGHEARR